MELKDIIKVVAEKQEDADSGNPKSQTVIGHVWRILSEYSKPSENKKQFQDLSRTYYESAAEHGSQDAQYQLGLIYDTGIGVVKNTQMAVNYFESAANQGNADAMYKLGTKYFNGFGVERDLEKAKKLIIGAKDQGHDKAKQFFEKVMKLDCIT